jgi:tetratricopeptide (TPR) repeat protein
MTPGFRALSARCSVMRACCAVVFVSAGCVFAQSPLAWGAAPAFVQDADATTAPVDRGPAYYHYGLARMYEDEASQNGRQDLATQAIEQYKLAMDADPASRELQDGLANLYFKLGRIREAVAAAQDQVAKHPDDADAHVLLGRVYLRSLGDGTGPQTGDMLSAAIKEYETIARLKPDDVETHLLLGQLYGLNHDSLKAEAQFKIAQGLDPNSEEVILSLARLYTEQGDLNKAAKVLADVPAEDRSARMNFALAGIYDQLKRPKEAVEAYRAVLAEDPDNADAKRGLAEALMASGQNDAAAKVLGDITKSDPQDARALIHEADLERRSGKYEQALATLEKASALVQNNLELDYNKALTEDALGRFDDSEKTLQNALEYSSPADGKYDDQTRNNRALFLDRLAVVAREKGDTAVAVKAYQEMGALGGDCSTSVGGACAAHAAEGEVDAYRDAHEWTKALQVAATAAKAMPDNHDIQLSYARQLADSGKVEDGLAVAKKLITGKDTDRDVYFTIADIDERARRWKDASVALDKVESMTAKPGEKAFLDYYRGSVAERQKLFDEAEMYFKKGLAIEPNDASIENDYGYMLADRGVRLDEAIAMIKHAVDYDPQNGAYLDSLGWAYYKQGQYALAEDYERKAVLRSGNDPAVLDHMGEIYAKTGKLQMAVSEWQKSLADYKTSLAPDANPADVAKVEKKLEGARVKLAHAGAASTGAVTR